MALQSGLNRINRARVRCEKREAMESCVEGVKHSDIRRRIRRRIEEWSLDGFQHSVDAS